MTKTISAEKRSFWEAKIQEQKSSGLSIIEWCQQCGITRSCFHYWKSRLYESVLTPDSFTELSSIQESGIFFEYKGIRIFVEKSFDIPTLTHCLLALRGLPC